MPRTTRQYLTPEIVRTLKQGESLRLGFDDFNQGEFQYTHDRCEEKGTMFPFDFTCYGTALFNDGTRMEFMMWAWPGPHPSPPIKKKIMCKGSAAERLFIL